MRIDEDYLKQAKKNLIEQYKELAEQVIEVKGVIKWITQTLKIYESKKPK
jgi:hypothetical protein